MNKGEVQTLPARQSCDGCVLKALGACSGAAGSAPVGRDGGPRTGAKKASQLVELKSLGSAPLSHMP